MMKIRSMMLAGALALSSAAVMSAKSYDIVLSGPSQAGTLQLAKGEYRLKVDGSNAVFTNVETGKKFTAPVKVGTAGKKFDETEVVATDKGGTARIQEIDLGGSMTQLQFTE